MVKKLFGTDGIRGIANIHPMTAEMALKLGRAAAYVFKRDKRPHRFVIGKDTRLSGYMIENALAAGLCSMGDEVMLVGPIPTPAIAFITRSLRADAGIVISASHNPYDYNGIKFFSSTGFKLPDELEEKIEELVHTGEIDSIRPTAHEIGKAYRIDDVEGRYVEFVKNTLPKGLDFSGFKVVCDCGNGASYKVAPWAFKELGAELVIIGDEPNGTNINLNCGSLYPEQLAMRVKEEKADVGFAFDGDADRVIIIDENGKILDGDHVIMIAAKFFKNSGLLKTNKVVSTVMANMGLDQTLKKYGLNVLKTKVGDRYVMEKMMETGSTIGGEQSGHIIFSDFNTTGDGLITALQIARVMKETGEPLSSLASELKKFPQYIQNVKVEKKTPFQEIPDILKEKEKIEKRLGENGRLLMRYSGTEPIVRIMIESIDELNIQELTKDLVSKLKTFLNGGSK